MELPPSWLWTSLAAAVARRNGIAPRKAGKDFIVRLAMIGGKV